MTAITYSTKYTFCSANNLRDKYAMHIILNYDISTFIRPDNTLSLTIITRLTSKTKLIKMSNSELVCHCKMEILRKLETLARLDMKLGCGTNILIEIDFLIIFWRNFQTKRCVAMAGQVFYSQFGSVRRHFRAGLNYKINDHTF